MPYFRNANLDDGLYSKTLSCKLQDILEKNNRKIINVSIGVLVVELQWFARLDPLNLTPCQTMG